MRPNDALNTLLAGNQRYISGLVDSYNPPEARADHALGQAPFAAIIRCADSRVAPEIVFDQSLGQLYVCAVAGNIPTPEIIASLEYTVLEVGCSLIVVMGHSCCAAVTEAVKHRENLQALPGSVPMLLEQIVIPRKVSEGAWEEEILNSAIAFNTLYGIETLMHDSEIIAKAVQSRTLQLVAGVLDIASGEFVLLG